jgi:hypothetical protein
MLPPATGNWIRMVFPLTSDPALKDHHGMEGVDVVEAGDVDPLDLGFWVMPSRFQNAALLEKTFVPNWPDTAMKPDADDIPFEFRGRGRPRKNVPGRNIKIVTAADFVDGTGGVVGPWLFGKLVETGSAGSIVSGYLLGAGLMVGAALVEWLMGVQAERRSLESIATPLSSAE